MGSITGLALAVGALAAGGSFIKSEADAANLRAQQKQQAAILKANAAQTRQQAQIAEQAGKAEAERIDRQKSQLRRNFETAQSRNITSLAAANVDPWSGSPLDVQLGNIDLFSADLAENAYAKALKEWETREQAKQARYQAQVYDSQASWLKGAANNVGQSLLTSALTAGISGLSAGLGGYAAAGGSFGLGKTASAANIWDKRLPDGSLIMRHPSGKWSQPVR